MVVEVVLEPAGDAVAGERSLPALEVAEQAAGGAEQHHRERGEPEMRAQVIGAAEDAQQPGDEHGRVGADRLARHGVVDGGAAHQRHAVVEQRDQHEAAERAAILQAMPAHERPDDLKLGKHGKGKNQDEEKPAQVGAGWRKLNFPVGPLTAAGWSSTQVVERPARATREMG